MRNIVCIGASTGGLDAIIRVVRALPADLPAAVFVVRHVASSGGGLLADILQPYSALPVSSARDGEAIQPGRIYLAPPNHHLLVDRRSVTLSVGPKENWVRPAIDPLFRTVAQHHGPRAIGIVLSGKLDDGTAGLWAVKRRGGFAVVQQPQDASAPDMPRNALAAVDVDVVADAEEIGALLPKWCRESSDFKPDELAGKTIELENAFLAHRDDEIRDLDTVGVHPSIVCPECGGKLWQMKTGPLRFRCHVGHGMSGHTLLAQQRAAAESAGWKLVRTLEEEVFVAQQLVEKIRPEARAAIISQLNETREAAERIRTIVQAHVQKGAAESPVPPEEECEAGA